MKTSFEIMDILNSKKVLEPEFDIYANKKWYSEEEIRKSIKDMIDNLDFKYDPHNSEESAVTLQLLEDKLFGEDDDSS